MNKVLERARDLSAEFKPTLKLALPIMAGMVSHMLMGLTDTLFVGRVGVIPLAAASFVSIVAHPAMVFAFGLLTSVSIRASQCYGAGLKRETGEVLRNGLILATVVGLLLGFMAILARPFLGFFGQAPEVVAASGAFFVLFSWSFLPALIAHTCKQFSESLNLAWIPNSILLASVVLNVIFNWVFVFGNLGSPALGLEGSGYATILSRTVGAVGILGYVLWSPRIREYRPKWFSKIKGRELVSLVTLGLPGGAQHLLEVSAFAFAGLMMGWISAQAIAAHQIALNCAATTFMFPLGLGMAVCIRVGHAYGAGEFEKTRRIGFSGLVLSGAIMALFGVAFLIAGRPLASLFVSAHDVILLTAQLLMVAAVFQIVDGLQVTAISALRGLSDVRAPAAVAVFAYWAVAVPCAWWLAFRLKLGAVGIWIGLAAGLFVAASCLSARLHIMTSLARKQ